MECKVIFRKAITRKNMLIKHYLTGGNDTPKNTKALLTLKEFRCAKMVIWFLQVTFQYIKNLEAVSMQTKPIFKAYNISTLINLLPNEQSHTLYYTQQGVQHKYRSLKSKYQNLHLILKLTKNKSQLNHLQDLLLYLSFQIEYDIQVKNTTNLNQISIISIKLLIPNLLLIQQYKSISKESIRTKQCQFILKNSFDFFNESLFFQTFNSLLQMIILLNILILVPPHFKEPLIPFFIANYFKALPKYQHVPKSQLSKIMDIIQLKFPNFEIAANIWIQTQGQKLPQNTKIRQFKAMYIGCKKVHQFLLDGKVSPPTQQLQWKIYIKAIWNNIVGTINKREKRRNWPAKFNSLLENIKRYHTNQLSTFQNINQKKERSY